MRTKVGCCGAGGALATYVELFDVLDDLKQIAAKLPERGSAYVLFNNIAMRKDAERFARLVS